MTAVVDTDQIRNKLINELKATYVVSLKKSTSHVIQYMKSLKFAAIIDSVCFQNYSHI